MEPPPAPTLIVALILTLISTQVAGVEPPKGYTRGKLEVGGIAFHPLPAAADGQPPTRAASEAVNGQPPPLHASEVVYVNFLDPCGLLPKSVVRKTVPERCKMIATLRGCCAEASSH